MDCIRRLVCALCIPCATFLAAHTTCAAEAPFVHTVIDRSPPMNPWTKIVSDFNGDGQIDIVIGGQNGPLVLYTYPSWGKSVIAEGGYSTVDGEAGDIDHDGDPDIVMGGLVWYENPMPVSLPETGMWKKHTVAEHPTHDVELADLDRDGDIDIVTRDQSEFNHKAGNEIHVFLQETPDEWKEQVIRCGHGEGITLADLDDDGDPDIVTGGVWFENTGEPAKGVWPVHHFAEFHRNATVMTGDIDNDGDRDVVLTPSELKGEYARISWFENPGNPGSPEKADWIVHSVDDPVECVYHSLELADVNGDGFIDILTAAMHQGADPDEVSVYYNPSGGAAWNKQVLSERGSHFIRAADIGGDGDIDIVGANHGGDYQPVELWENRLSDDNRALRSWTYIEVDNARAKWGDWNDPEWLRYFGLSMKDVDGDGFLDIASGRYFYRNPGGDMTGQWIRTDFGMNIDAMLFVDIDGDRYSDIVAEALPDVYWLEAMDSGGVRWRSQKICEIPKTSHVNGQGYKLAQIVAGGKPEILLSSGDGIYRIDIPADPGRERWNAVRIAPGAIEEGIGIGDIDGDGDLDIAAGSGEKLKDTAVVSWWENPGNGDGDWTRRTVGETIRFGDRFEVADLNGDGLQDIVVAEERWPEPEDAHVFWFEQTKSSGRRWIRHTVVTQNTSNNLDCADMDGDGDIDIVTAEHRGTKRMEIFENRDNAAVWIPHTLSTGKESHLGARVADMDGDGDPDVVSIAWDAYQFLHVWRNDAVSGRR